MRIEICFLPPPDLDDEDALENEYKLNTIFLLFSFFFFLSLFLSNEKLEEGRDLTLCYSTRTERERDQLVFALSLPLWFAIFLIEKAKRMD